MSAKKQKFQVGDIVIVDDVSGRDQTNDWCKVGNIYTIVKTREDLGGVYVNAGNDYSLFTWRISLAPCMKTPLMELLRSQRDS